MASIVGFDSQRLLHALNDRIRATLRKSRQQLCLTLFIQQLFFLIDRINFCSFLDLFLFSFFFSFLILRRNHLLERDTSCYYVTRNYFGAHRQIFRGRSRGFWNVSDVGEAKRLELDKMKNLIDLRLNFDRGRWRWRKKDDEQQLLEALQTPLNLKELAIEPYRGNAVFPSWMISLTNLNSYGKNCGQLPLFGKLLSLEKH